jgi:hypothetical protein
LEVQSRAAHAPGRLSGPAALAWARRWAVLALATTLCVTAIIISAQPVRSPWWTYADADASYASAALTLVLGQQVRFVDHPGLPITEAAAVAFGVDAFLHEHSLSPEARRRYVDATLLDLDSGRGVFRGVSIAIYLLGAVLSFFLLGRLFGHWTWGFAGSLLWVAAPGLAAMSIQLRPDVALGVVTLAFAYAIARGVQTRDPVPYAVAAALVGFAVMIKLHGLGLVAPLAIAAVWRPPDGLPRRPSRRTLLAVFVPWILLAILFNVARAPFSLTSPQWLVLAALAVSTALAIGAAAAWRPLRPLGLLIGGLSAGVLMPVTLDIPDGFQALVNVVKAATGHGVSAGVASFSTPFSDLGSIVGSRVVVLYLLAAVAAGVGLYRRQPEPVVWFAGVVVMIVLAFARPPNVHYFAPAFLLAVPCVLWLVQRTPGSRAPILLWPVVLLLVWPAFRERDTPAIEAERFAALVASTKHKVDRLLQPGEVALAPSYWPFADVRYFELVQIYAAYSPEYPYRYLPATGAARDFVAQRNWRPRYYIGPQAQQIDGEQPVKLAEFGAYTARPLAGTDLGLELLGGPGADRLWARPDAVYDPATGYFRSSQGLYYNRLNEPQFPKTRRRYLPAKGLWLDRFGDMWDRWGNLVEHHPELRQAP